MSTLLEEYLINLKVYFKALWKSVGLYSLKVQAESYEINPLKKELTFLVRTWI